MYPHPGIEVRPHECRLMLQSTLDYSNTPRFHKACSKLISHAESTRIVLDCSNLVYIDTIGISALIVANNRATQEGKPLELHNCNRHFRQLLKLTRLGKVLKLA